MVVPSPLHYTSHRKAKSLGDAKTLVKTPIDRHHVGVFPTVVVPYPSCHTSPQKAKLLRDVKALLPDNDTLVLQNHFSSLDGLETTYHHIKNKDLHICYICTLCEKAREIYSTFIF